MNSLLAKARCDVTSASLLLMLLTIVAVLLVPPSQIDGSLSAVLFYNFPKLQFDYQIVTEGVGQTWAARYLISQIVSAFLFLPLSVFAVFSSRSFVTQATVLPKYIYRSALLIFPIVALVCIYLLYFDTWISSSNTRVSEAIFGSILCIIWPPLLWAAFASTVQRWMQNVWARILNRWPP